MYHTLKKSWPYLLIALVIYFAPALAQLYANPVDVKGVWFAALLLFNPVAALTLGAVFGYRHGFRVLFALLITLLFIPAALIVYNDSAFVYLIPYAIAALLGLTLGWALHRLSERPCGQA